MELYLVPEKICNKQGNRSIFCRFCDLKSFVYRICDQLDTTHLLLFFLSFLYVLCKTIIHNMDGKMKKSLVIAGSVLLTLPILASADIANNGVSYPVPADKFDMTNWKITIPADLNKDGRVDEIEGVAMMSYSHSDFFFLDKDGNMVFEVQNKAITTKNSKNARSELRQMPRGAKFHIDTAAPLNNFALASHPKAADFSSIGGTLEATLKVNHISEHAKFPERPAAHSVVVGQIHAKKYNDQIKAKTGFGHGNEPLKIFFKKFPGHKYGSVFWNYERNLAKKIQIAQILHTLFGEILGKTLLSRVKLVSLSAKNLVIA